MEYGAVRDGDTPSFGRELARRVMDTRSRLSRNDRQIVDYLREHPERIAFLTSAAVSREVGVSQAAVVRFATRLGYTGFKQLRDEARRELREDGESPAERFSSGERRGYTGRRFDQDVENLLETERLAEPELVTTAATIAKAESVHVIGDRDSLALAMFFQRRLHIVRGRVHLVDPGFPDPVAEVEEGDVVVACVFKRYSRLTIQLLELARERGAQAVVVTDGDREDFLWSEDRVLVALTESLRFHWSMAAPIALLESLVSEVAEQNPVAARDRLRETEEFKNQQGFFL
jgi:DNA-binding MurR/RpiR family transcriptional regulator